MSTIVKICGITNTADALAAADAGADAIGLMFYEKSPRNLTIPAASEIACALPPHVIKVGVFAFRISDAESLKPLPSYPTDAWLLDAYSPDKPGGTGGRFNWDLAIEAQKLGKPIFLAGGLTPENVADAIRKVRPYAVDVSSGVESSPGKKDHAKVVAFIKAAKNL